MSTPDAARVGIFTTLVLTHRRKALDELVNSKKFQRRWPEALRRKVDGLIGKGANPLKVPRRILREDGIYIKIKTVRTRMRVLENRGMLSPSMGKGDKTTSS